MRRAAAATASSALSGGGPYPGWLASRQILGVSFPSNRGPGMVAAVSRPGTHGGDTGRACRSVSFYGEIFSCSRFKPPKIQVVTILFRLSRMSTGGSVANPMAQSTGVQRAFPKRQVISFSGDGGFTMLMGDFISLVQPGLPRKGGRLPHGNRLPEHGYGLKNPNFAAMAEADGVRGIRVERPGDVETPIAEALAYDGPALVDAEVNRAELSMPSKPNRERIKEQVERSLMLVTSKPSVSAASFRVRSLLESDRCPLRVRNLRSLVVANHRHGRRVRSHRRSCEDGQTLYRERRSRWGSSLYARGGGRR